MTKMMPFLFHTNTGYMVKIASFDYVEYDSSWMCDDRVGESCLVPDVDIAYERHGFKTESEALAFIAKWWRKNG